MGNDIVYAKLSLKQLRFAFTTLFPNTKKAWEGEVFLCLNARAYEGR